ncbi:tyrosine-protein phosphatase [Marinicellulosiphila megalodicopiae]|uniref:tyrosine-protein phosphatase n=1 Tax=Marinicellulosiphila megalodicopiae TaxID=2724896 RepID=UPI003BAEDE93
MFDLHCHILPGIDDGASTLEDTHNLLTLSIEQGVTHMVATPHIRFGRFENSIKSINAAFEIVQRHILDQNLPIILKSAAEVHICPEIMILAQQKALPFLGQYDGSDVLLLELPNDHIPAGTEKLISWLAKQNIKSMIAHPERNKTLRKHPEKIQEFKKLGCLFQVTGAAFLGDMGENAQVISERWLKEGVFNIMASDCHNMLKRAPKLDEAFARVTQIAGINVANDLTINTPKLITESLFHV